MEDTKDRTMTDIAALEMQPDGSISLECMLPIAAWARYKFADTRALITFIHNMHHDVKINREVLDLAGPVPSGLMFRTQLMLAIIKKCVEFIDFYQPQSAWSKELSAVVLDAMPELDEWVN